MRSFLPRPPPNTALVMQTTDPARAVTVDWKKEGLALWIALWRAATLVRESGSWVEKVQQFMPTFLRCLLEVQKATRLVSGVHLLWVGWGQGTAALACDVGYARHEQGLCVGVVWSSSQHGLASGPGASSMVAPCCLMGVCTIRYGGCAAMWHRGCQ